MTGANATETSVKTTATSANATMSKKPMNIVYYPDWASWSPAQVDYSLFDILLFGTFWVNFPLGDGIRLTLLNSLAFALPGPDFSLYWTREDSGKQLKNLVKASHDAGRKCLLSVGGWT